MADFVTVARLDEVPADGMLAVSVDGRDIVLCRLGETICALANRCTHEQELLSDGVLDAENREIECPKHYGLFNVDTGKPTALPPTTALETYETRIDGNAVQVLVT